MVAVRWYKVGVTEDRVLRVASGPAVLCDLLLDASELFVKVAELGTVFRLVIPTLHHDCKDLLRTVLWG